MHLIVLLLLITVGARPVTELYSSFFDDEFDAIELVGEEDAEEEIDDLEEDKFFDQEGTYLAVVSKQNESIFELRLDPGSLFYPGVLSPPPECTLS